MAQTALMLLIARQQGDLTYIMSSSNYWPVKQRLD